MSEFYMGQKCGIMVTEERLLPIIKNLQEQVLKKETNLVWNSVKDCLPPFNERVLLCLQVHEGSPIFMVGQLKSESNKWIIDSFSYDPNTEIMINFETKWTLIIPPSLVYNE